MNNKFYEFAAEDIKGQVVDMSQFYTQYEKVKPYLINNDLPPAAAARTCGPHHRHRADRNRRRARIAPRSGGTGGPDRPPGRGGG